VFLRYSLACSSDQKKTLFFQNASMMLGSFKVLKSTSGTNTTGLQFGSSQLQCISLLISICIGRFEKAHSEITLMDTSSPLSRPCTKGVANASTAQAAYSRSPVRKVIAWGVFSTVTG